MTTTMQMFQTTSRHSGLRFAVIASLCISLAIGFVAQAWNHATAADQDLRASATVSSAQHAS